VDVTTGLEANGMTAVLRGLAAGQKVVTSGQFLIDSEASLKATTTRLSESPPPAGQPAAGAPDTVAGAPGAELHHAEGRVDKVDADTVTISHGAVPSLHWPPMTMGFRLPKAGVPAVKPGERVRFDFAQRADGEFEIRSVTPEPDDKGAGK
jgi:membrane fusion protein, copper/silver efflux system